MSLYGLLDSCPEYYIISIINSTFISEYVDVFVNNTQTFQINIARQLPIIIPDELTLKKVKCIYDNAISIKQKYFDNLLSEYVAELKLENIQIELDNLVKSLYFI